MKNIFASKTFWFNLVSLILIAVQALEGAPWMNPLYQGAILAIGNAFLRMISGQPVSLTGSSKVIGFLLLAITLGGAGACTDFSSKAGNVASVASQASGAVKGLIDVALAAPLDDATKDQIAVYGRWATLATDAVTGVSKALSAADAVEQATGTVQAVNKIVQAAPIPADTKATAGGWADWALIALRAAATILPMVL